MRPPGVDKRRSFAKLPAMAQEKSLNAWHYIDGTWHHGDPYDRLILATALAAQAHLATKDQGLRDFFPEHTLWD